MPELCEVGTNPLKVGKMEYGAVIVPSCETLRSTTLARLEAFANDGGNLIFMGNAPSLCDAKPSDRGAKLFDRSRKVDFSRAAILEALENERTITLRNANGKLTDNLIYRMRQDNDCRWLFICYDKEPINKDAGFGGDITLHLKGEWRVELYDTANAEIHLCKAKYKNGDTVEQVQKKRTIEKRVLLW